jgi:hypothetical protein
VGSDKVPLSAYHFLLSAFAKDHPAMAGWDSIGRYLKVMSKGSEMKRKC